MTKHSRSFRSSRRRPCARAPDARLRPPFALGAVGPVPEPLRGGPLLPPVDRAAPVQGLRVVVTGRVHGPEQKRGALSRRDVQLARRARRGEASFGSVFRVFRVVRRRATSAFKNRHRLVFFSHSFAPGKHRLAASLDVAQVHQHSRDALAAVLDVFVVREVIGADRTSARARNAGFGCPRRDRPGPSRTRRCAPRCVARQRLRLGV